MHETHCLKRKRRRSQLFSAIQTNTNIYFFLLEPINISIYLFN